MGQCKSCCDGKSSVNDQLEKDLQTQIVRRITSYEYDSQISAKKVVPRIALSPTTNLSSLSPEQQKSDQSSFSKVIQFENSQGIPTFLSQNLGKTDIQSIQKDLNQIELQGRSNSAGLTLLKQKKKSKKHSKKEEWLAVEDMDKELNLYKKLMLLTPEAMKKKYQEDCSMNVIAEDDREEREDVLSSQHAISVYSQHENSVSSQRSGVKRGIPEPKVSQGSVKSSFKASRNSESASNNTNVIRLPSVRVANHLNSQQISEDESSFQINDDNSVYTDTSVIVVEERKSNFSSVKVRNLGSGRHVKQGSEKMAPKQRSHKGKQNSALGLASSQQESGSQSGSIISVKRISTDKQDSEEEYEDMQVVGLGVTGRNLDSQVFEIDEKEEHVNVYSEDEQEMGINNDPKLSEIFSKRESVHTKSELEDSIRHLPHELEAQLSQQEDNGENI